MPESVLPQPPEIFGNSNQRDSVMSLTSPKSKIRSAALTGPRYLGKRSFLEASLESELSDSDILRMEPSVDGVREAVNFFRTKAAYSPYKAVVIDDAEFLSEPAQDALLKLVEEPPTSVGRIFFVTEDEGLLLPPLQNRLESVIRWKILSELEMRAYIETSMTMDDGALRLSRGRPGLYKVFLENSIYSNLHISCIRILTGKEDLILGKIPEAISGLKSGRSVERDSVCHVISASIADVRNDYSTHSRARGLLRFVSDLNKIPSLNAEIHWQRACLNLT